MSKIADLLTEELIISNIASRDKHGVLREFAELLYRAGKVNDVALVEDVLARREALGSTGIGDGIAIPHGKLAGLREIILAFGVSRDGVEFEALDGKPSHIFFLLVAPEDAPSEHLKALARISRLLKSSMFREDLMVLTDSKGLLRRIVLEEEDLA
ncbi:MAG: PTS sugar transporter subunit IIA [Nitrospirota bacterium]|nr:PTS sugar transporter subunit IIA [Nitrospirota bacterium]